MSLRPESAELLENPLERKAETVPAEDDGKVPYRDRSQVKRKTASWF